ncbi:hypothetical protein A2U01_0071739, partial [Trifolium medium]|nr:hypothetical protein [Trifolium medium]
MRSQVSTDELLFDPEIEKTSRRNNGKTRKRKKLAKQKKLQEGTYAPISSISPIAEEIMAEEEPNCNNNNANGGGGGVRPCHNSPR